VFIFAIISHPGEKKKEEKKKKRAREQHFFLCEILHCYKKKIEK
jgi:hypothetical protein